MTAGDRTSGGIGVGALGGVAGPAVFITTWAALGARSSGYSPIHDPISRLAAVGAPSGWVMTGGMLGLGVGVGLFSRVLGLDHPRAAGAALVTAASSIAVAATPLDGPLGDRPHAVAAGLAYASLAAVPGLVGRDALRAGSRRGGKVALGVAAGTAGCLLASLADPAHTGLWQRAGLTIGHLWIVSQAVEVIEGQRTRPRPPRARGLALSRRRPGR